MWLCPCGVNLGQREAGEGVSQTDEYLLLSPWHHFEAVSLFLAHLCTVLGEQAL